MGVEVWKAQTIARDILDPLKASLREEASRLLDGPGTATIEGEGFTQATVTVLPPMMKLKDEPFNIEEARAALGPDFDRVFRVILRPEANNFLHTLPPAAQRFLSRVVDQAKETPRVSLQSPGSGIEDRKRTT